MRRKRILATTLGVVVLLLVIANTTVSAHWLNFSWAGEHWHYYPSKVMIAGDAVGPAWMAMWDISYKTDLDLTYTPTYPADITVYNANYGPTYWVGLAYAASIGWQWHCFWWCDLRHAVALLNDNYFTYEQRQDQSVNSAARGVFCQEIAHTLKLDHHPNGDCMSKSYFYPCRYLFYGPKECNVLGPHSIADLNGWY